MTTTTTSTSTDLTQMSDDAFRAEYRRREDAVARLAARLRDCERWATAKDIIEAERQHAEAKLELDAIRAEDRRRTAEGETPFAEIVAVEGAVYRERFRALAYAITEGR